MTTYRLSTAAAVDIDEIFVYGIENYGLIRATDYMTGLSGAIEMLCDHPMLGRRADELAMDLRRLEYQTHIVFYQLNRECIHIVRILHDRMDVDGQAEDWLAQPVDRISDRIPAYL